MGWQLAEQVAWARPDRPGPEWWTLMDIAQDARDHTRRSMCGTDYLMARGKCSRATLYRRLKKLTDDNLIRVVRRSAPGVRAVYEVSDELTTGLTIVETCSDLSVSETRTSERVSKSSLTGLTFGRTGLSVSETHAVIPPSDTPSRSARAGVVTTSVEGTGWPVDNGASRQSFEREAWLASQIGEVECQTASSEPPTSTTITSAA